jgi:hypothetical protein
VAGLGGIVAWSGLKGKSWSQVIQTLIKGRSPKDLPQAEAITGAPADNTTSGPGQVTQPVSAKETAVWSAMIISAGGIPKPALIRSLVAWRGHESPWDKNPPDGALYTHNPLNTTYDHGSIGSVNSVGVKIYPNWTVGIRATVATWSGYPKINAAIRAGRPLCGPGFSDEFLKWSGNGYSSVC